MTSAYVYAPEQQGGNHAKIAKAEEIRPNPQRSEYKLLREAYRMTGEHGGQCVEFIQRLYNSFYTDPGFRGVAGKIVPNTQEPKMGRAVITSEGSKGHVGLIIGESADTIFICESNYSLDEKVSCGREIDKSDRRIIGYFDFANSKIARFSQGD